MAAIQRLTKHARDVFRLLMRDRSVNSDKLKSLQEEMSQIQASDLSIGTENQDTSSISGSADQPSAAGAGGDASRRAPVGYMHVFEDEVLSMGVFIIREGGRIPLHDHPGMYGLIKVLYGNINIRSFNEIGPEDSSKPSIPEFEGFPENNQPMHHLLVPTLLGVDQLFSPASDTAVLTPGEGNYHSLESVGGDAAFLDILSPPYDPPRRDCHYFKELRVRARAAMQMEDKSETRADICWLMRASQPFDFWCDEVDYCGPDADVQINS